MREIYLATFLSLGFSTAAVAAEKKAPPMQEAMPGMLSAISTMDADMKSAKVTGDPDRDFVNMMLPHHKGAVDMAKAYLVDGKDPAIRKRAEQIIKDQEKEIVAFKKWQEAHP